MKKDWPKVTAIIVNWNGTEDTIQCINDLMDIDYPELSLVVVDNGSTDGSVTRIGQSFDRIDMTEFEDNLGFAVANNRVLESGLIEESEYVLFVNNDVLIPNKDVVKNLVEKLESEEQLAALSPIITGYPDGKMWFRRSYFDRITGQAGHMGDLKWYLTPHLYINNILNPSEPMVGSDVVISPYLPFCFTLVRSSVFKNVGLYPEGYFVYGGDIELGVRLRQHGYTVGTYVKSNILHKVSASVGDTTGPIASYYLARNKWIMQRRLDDTISGLFYPYFIWWFILHAVLRTFGQDMDGLKALFEGTIDGIAAREGKGQYP